MILPTLSDVYSDINASSTNLLVSINATPEECERLGTAKVNIDGGVEPYNITWSNGAKENASPI